MPECFFISLNKTGCASEAQNKSHFICFYFALLLGLHYFCQRFMKFVILYFTVLAMLFSACEAEKTDAGNGSAVDTIPFLVTRIRNCSKLYTAEYRVHKIITHDDDIRFKGVFFKNKFDVALPGSTRKIAIPVDAKLKAYIDFSDFSEKNIVRRGDNIEIILPDPEIEMTSTRIDHDNIKKQVSLVRRDFTDRELSAYEAKGRESIIGGISGTGIISMAREGAAHALIPVIRQLGFGEGNIRVTFRKDFTAEDILSITNFTDKDVTKDVLPADR